LSLIGDYSDVYRKIGFGASTDLFDLELPRVKCISSLSLKGIPMIFSSGQDVGSPRGYFLDFPKNNTF
jgi:hypothetical protein